MRRGFTLIELIVSIGILLILITLTSINYFSVYPRANLAAAEDVLIADLKTVQSNAMFGGGDTIWDTFISNLPHDITLTTTLVNNQLTFLHGSGEIANYTPGQDTITLTNGMSSRTLRFNQFGAIIGD